MDGDSDSSPFEVCPECGCPVVGLDQHTCRSDNGGTKPASEEREQLAAEDDRDSSRGVLLPPGTGAKAYHELDDDHADPPTDPDPDMSDIVCWQDPDLGSATIRTQVEATDRGYYPCRSCQRIERSRTNQST